MLLSVVNLARRRKIDPESALRLANQRFRERFAEVARLARAAGKDVSETEMAELDRYWEEAKAEIAGRRLIAGPVATARAPRPARASLPFAASPGISSSRTPSVTGYGWPIATAWPSSVARRTSSASCRRIAGAVSTSSRKTRRETDGTEASSAVFSATVASVVRLSRKNSPRAARTRATTRMTRTSAVATEPMWLLTPTAPGTVARSASRTRTISSSDCDRRMTPGPGRTFG